MNSLNKERFEYLDGIRGVAALIVVVNHFRNAFYDIAMNSPFFSFFWEKLKLFFFKGDFCVEVFFVLSGFVLAYNSIYKKDFLNKQWLKRFYRLAVPVFITSICYFIFSNYGLFYFKELCKLHFTEWASHHWLIHYSLPQFIVRCLYDFLLFSDWQFVMNINSSLWTIPIELYWSYLLFILFFTLKMVKYILYKNLILVFYSGLILICLNFKGIEFGVLFMLGTLIAINYNFIITKFNTNLIHVITILITLVLTYIVELNVLKNFSFISWHNLIACIYIIVAIRVKYIQTVFSFSIIKWLGRISFSLYLLHILIIGSFSSKIYLIYPFFRKDIGLIILLIVTLVFATFIAHIYTVYIDEKLMKLYDMFFLKIKSKYGFNK